MELIIKPPSYLLIICFGVLGVTLLSMILKKGEWKQKIVALVIMVIVLGGVLFFFYKDTKVLLNEEGIYNDSYGKTDLSWNEIRDVLVIEDIKASPYKPKIRLSGIGAGSLKMGWYTLENGNKAKIVMQTMGKTMAIFSSDTVYLFAPENIDPFIEALKKYYPGSISYDQN